MNSQKVPFGRSVEIKDIIPILDFLMSEKSSFFITGVNIPVTGGMNFLKSLNYMDYKTKHKIKKIISNTLGKILKSRGQKNSNVSFTWN